MAETTYEISAAACAEIDKWLAKFPPEGKQSALIEALKIVQAEHDGWLSVPAMDAVAEYIGIPKITVYEVASFYTLYDLEPVGRHKIYVCTSISCMLRGSKDIVNHLKEKLAIDFGETTADGKFTLKNAECLAACGRAPAIQINEQFHENLTPNDLDKILEGLD